MAQTDDQIENLFGFTARFAQEMLSESGDFYPFGATISADGKIAAVNGDVGGEENPQPRDVYESISAQLVRIGAAGGVEGVALVARVDIPDDLGAQVEKGIRVHIEGDGFARFIYIPYEIRSAGEPAVHLHELLAVEVQPQFFKAQSPD